jgi:phosphoribosylformylglycinamidine synthase
MACVGAELLAITDGLNFASPRDPIEHLRIVEVIRGLADGLRILGVPVTGGNVSLYNQSPRGVIPPTPMIGALGVVADVRVVPPSIVRSGERLLLLGSLSAQPGASRYARLRCGQVAGVPSVDLQAELRLAKVLQAAIAERLIAATKPVSQGGLAATLARWCLRSQVGAQLDIPSACEWLLFGEHPAQVLLTTSHAEQERRLEQIATQHQVPLTRLGEMGGEHLHISGVLKIALDQLRLAAEQRAVIR